MEQCPYCKKYLLANQKSEHVCDTPLRTVTEIPVVFSYETKTEDGNSVVIAMGFDGILYRLVRCRNPLVDRQSSDEYLHDKRTRRRFDSTLDWVLLTFRRVEFSC